MRFVNPSKDDAWDLTRNEKTSLQFLAHAVSALVAAQDDLSERLDRIENGQGRMKAIADESIQLLTEVRQTVPEKQRMNLVNISKDYEVRLVPKFTPSTHNVVVQKEDFRELVDAAQAKCKDCTLDNEECRKCKLYQLLVTVLPMDHYDGVFLCPYNMAEWEN
jgi:hypothetical protein